MINLDKLWTLIPAAKREEYIASKGKNSKAPVINVLDAGYSKVLGKGRLPADVPIVVKARYFSKDAERKIKENGGVVQLVG